MPALAGKGVVAGTAGKPVVALARHEHVGARATGQEIRGCRADHALDGGDLVVALPAAAARFTVTGVVEAA